MQRNHHAWREAWRTALEEKAQRLEAAVKLAAVLARRRVRARLDVEVC
jgi:hypothetical protein